jgi:hypothetical protein
VPDAVRMETKSLSAILVSSNYLTLLLDGEICIEFCHRQSPRLFIWVLKITKYVMGSAYSTHGREAELNNFGLLI